MRSTTRQRRAWRPTTCSARVSGSPRCSWTRAARCSARGNLGLWSDDVYARWQNPGMTRRSLLRCAALGTVALASGTKSRFGETVSGPPNIVFIMADDLGYADVSCYGRPDLHTPNIDRLAANGVRFLQAYANSAVCSATRLALITGRYQYRLPLGLEEPLTGRDVGLPPAHPTLPSLLRKAGYGTTLVGKWHLGALPRFGPLRSGYDHFYGFRGGGVDYYTHAGLDQKDDLWDDDVPVHQIGYLTDLLGSRAVDVVNSYAKSGRPFLVSLHFNAPHWPWEAPGDEAESERLRRKSLFDFDGGTQKTYQRMIERWICRSDACCRRSTRTV